MDITLGNIKIGGNNPMVLIAGPCVIESEKSAIHHAEEIKKITEKLGIPFIFKSSYDKANRTSIKSYRGPGIDKGLQVLLAGDVQEWISIYSPDLGPESFLIFRIMLEQKANKTSPV